MSGEPLDKDELIRDLRRQLAAAQSELRLNKRRAETRGALIDRLREAPRKEATAPVEVTKLGRPRGLWHSPVLLGVVVTVMLAFAVDAAVGRRHKYINISNMFYFISVAGLTFGHCVELGCEDMFSITLLLLK